MNKAISELLSKSTSEGSLIGVNCLVFKDGKELYSGSFGFADRENKIPMSRDSIFRLFSLSKPVTSAAAMILIDRGILSPDDPVSKFFPEYADLRYSAGRDESGSEIILPCPDELKISHLLTMTSGLPYANNFCESVCASARLFDAVIRGNDGQGAEVTTEEFTRRAAEIPLMFRPGEHWDYGISADILGGVIEKASGVKYSRFLKENIFEPLGMKDTGFFIPAEKLSRFTALYKYENDKLIRDHENYLGLTDYTAPPSFESGGAGLVSTIADYAKFANMLCNRGKFGDVQLISSETFNYMTAPKLGAVQQSDLWERLSGYNYACLMRIMTDEASAEIKTSNGEFGWDGWTGTYFCANPENGIVCLCFTQIAGAGTTWQAQEIDKIVYDELVR